MIDFMNFFILLKNKKEYFNKNFNVFLMMIFLMMIFLHGLLTYNNMNFQKYALLYNLAVFPSFSFPKSLNK